MELRDTTRTLLRLVETETGFPVEALEDDSLSSLATVRMARDPMACHIIRYKPTVDRSLDYLVCFQCGFILRFFQPPPDQQFDLSLALAGREAVAQALRSSVLFNLPQNQLVEFQAQLCQGLLTHLRSIPIGLRVAAWLAQHYPELREPQQSVVLRELDDAKATLAPHIRDSTPSSVYRPTQAISAAYALYWAEQYGRRELAGPYRGTDCEADGRALLRIWHNLSDDPLYDRALIDAWATHLGLVDWYQWLPYRAPQ